MKPSPPNAKQTIYGQEVSLAVRHSAWFLFQHQLSTINPRTERRFTYNKALSNTLDWLSEQKAREDAALNQLTTLQKQIMRLLVEEELTQKEMALKLGCSREAIKHNYRRIKRKLGVVSMYRAAAIAMERGWVNASQVEE